jgi:hypothetical protein
MENSHHTAVSSLWTAPKVVPIGKYRVLILEELQIND